MKTKPKSRLGRGLAGIISSAKPATTATTAKPSAQQAAATASLQEIPLHLIEPSAHQARKEINPAELTELAESIRSEGLLQPVTVRKIGSKYQLIAGERRWRAYQLLKLKTIPAILNTTAGESSAAVLGLIENLQRADLNPVEEALGYASLIRDFKLTAETAAERVGKPRTTVANILRLLQLDKEIQGYISKNLLSTGHAKVLLSLPDPAQRAILARRILTDGLSVRATEKIVQSQTAPATAAPSSKPGKKATNLNNATRATLTAIEKKLTSQLGARTQLQHTPKKGKIIIHYSGNEDLQRLLDTLKVQI